VVVAAARFTVMPFAVICPSAPEAFEPDRVCGRNGDGRTGVTVHDEFTTMTGLGHTCAKAGNASPLRREGRNCQKPNAECEATAAR